ncbi:nuclear transport factor 2 family protein [Paraburkholderia oxyphila]|uniref:nuclear transport factor 2 family protein n=1 Tax=Paraburkholderia oxyphila TaxID=614212 RepID=UPI00048174FC|nr:nuclear transport factor 2 family protein [Paraburkholderia oxyphila]
MKNGALGLGALLRSEDDPQDSAEGRRAGKDAVKTFLKAIASRDMAALSGAVADDVIYEMPFSETGSTEVGRFRRYVGREEVVSFWSGMSSSGIKSESPDDVELSITGDGSRIFIEQRGNMTMPDGKEYRNRYVFRFDIIDGKVSHVKEYLNPIVSAYAFDRPVANGIRIGSV